MIDLKKITKNEILKENKLNYVDYYKQSLKARGDNPSIIDELIELNQKRKQLVTESETAKAEQNKFNQEIARLKRSGEDATELLEKMQSKSAEVKKLEKDAQELSAELNTLQLNIPNILHPTVPFGDDEKANKEIFTWGEIRKFDFDVKDHTQLGECSGNLDFERGGKVAGARFTFLKGFAARLERALIQFMMDTHSKVNGYTEIIPPYIVNSQSLQGTGQFPKFKQDVFNLSDTDYYLIPTAEVPVTNYFADETLDEADLPIHFVAFSPCFRSEAGSYGKDTKGLIRQHQFHKVELLKFVHPDKSYEEHDKLTEDAEKILQMLDLPYRKVILCSGDISFSAAKCYDLEVWMPGQQSYREISSCSNFEDFQARRANIRFKPKGTKTKPEYVHTLNGSGLAVGRTLIAIMENYQNSDGSIDIPEVLKKYM